MSNSKGQRTNGQSFRNSSSGIYWNFDKKRIEALIPQEEPKKVVKKKRSLLKK